jgi:RNA polymerase sigma factor (sigma-70 family)
VKADRSSRAGDSDRFRTTQWSVVLLSAQSQAPGSQAALAELCRLYWYPLYGFVRWRGYAPEEAKDLTQGFFLDLLERKTLKRADPQKGKFRSFLLASLRNYLSNEAVRARALKRGGKTEFVHLDMESAEDRYRLEPVDKLTPERIFDARWALALLGEARNRLSCEYNAEGRGAAFEALKAFLDPANSQELPSYGEVADKLKLSVAAIKTLIHRLRKRYSSLVREEISRTVAEAGDVDAEIHELCEALIATEGWIVP